MGFDERAPFNGHRAQIALKSAECFVAANAVAANAMRIELGVNAMARGDTPEESYPVGIEEAVDCFSENIAKELGGGRTVRIQVASAFLARGLLELADLLGVTWTRAMVLRFVSALEPWAPRRRTSGLPGPSCKK